METVESICKNTIRPNTEKSYSQYWEQFTAWCLERDMQPEIATHYNIAEFLTYLHNKNKKLSTINQALYAITYKRKEMGLDDIKYSGLILQFMDGLRNKMGVAQKKKKPITYQKLQKILPVGNKLIDIRDAAILALLFAGAFRRSELAQLLISDLEFHEQGLLVKIPRSKTDPTGKGQEVAIPYTTHTNVPALVQKWIETAQITHGALFRSIDKAGRLGNETLHDNAINKIVKKHLSKNGFNADEYSAHCLRAGLVSSAYEAEVETKVIQDTTRHRNVASVIKYDYSSHFRNNAWKRIEQSND